MIFHLKIFSTPTESAVTVLDVLFPYIPDPSVAYHHISIPKSNSVNLLNEGGEREGRSTSGFPLEES